MILALPRDTQHIDVVYRAPPDPPNNYGSMDSRIVTVIINPVREERPLQDIEDIVCVALSCFLSLGCIIWGGCNAPFPH